jgi:hypothetical protein
VEGDSGDRSEDAAPAPVVKNMLMTKPRINIALRLGRCLKKAEVRNWQDRLMVFRGELGGTFCLSPFGVVLPKTLRAGKEPSRYSCERDELQEARVELSGLLEMSEGGLSFAGHERRSALCTSVIALKSFLQAE